MKRIDADRARQLAWLAVAIYIVGLGISATFRKQGDFNVYYRAGHRVLHGLAIYPPDESDRFLYAPAFAIAFAPFAAVPRHLAQFFFFAINAYALIEFVLGTGVLLFGRAVKLSATLIVVPLLLTFRFIDNNFEHGQINIPTLALCVWALIYSRESRPRLAGVMLATAVLIKPFAVLVALYLAVQRRLDVLAWTFLAAVVILVLPIAVFGYHRWIAQTSSYLAAVSSMTTRYRTMLTNQSAVSAVARLMSLRSGFDADGSPIPTIVGSAFELIMVVAVLLWNLRSRETRDFTGQLALCGLFCLMPSLAPISWKSYYAAMLVPYMALVAAFWHDREASVRPPMIVAVLFALSVLMNFAPGNFLNRLAMFYSAHFLSSLIALAALFLLWRSRVTQPASDQFASVVNADRI
ncbi:MAG: hypothetical protein JWM69_299 [Candidatus Binatus sp.]|nr:hypothetical protein [Candidatus Binatus sp.]